MFGKNKKSKEFITGQITQLEIACKELGHKVDNGMTMEEYQADRLGINFILIKAIFGMEIEEDAKRKIKQNHRIANMEELSKLVNILSEFQENTERRFLVAANRAMSGGEDGEDTSMDIPVRLMSPTLPELKKYNQKEITKYILGDGDSSSCLSKVFITPAHIFELAAIAKKIKKHNQTKMMLLIGGIALIIAGGTIAAIMIKKHHKGAATDVDEALEAASDIDLDSIDINLDDTSDVPNVELPE